MGKFNQILYRHYAIVFTIPHLREVIEISRPYVVEDMFPLNYLFKENARN